MGMSMEEYRNQTGRFQVRHIDDLPEEMKVRDIDMCCCCCVVRVENDNVVEVIAWDGGEPEDQLLTRDWRWVPLAMNQAYQRGFEVGEQVGRNVKTFGGDSKWGSR